MKDHYDEGLHMAQLYHKLKNSRHAKSAVAMTGDKNENLMNLIERDHAQSIKNYAATQKMKSM